MFGNYEYNNTPMPTVVTKSPHTHKTDQKPHGQPYTPLDGMLAHFCTTTGVTTLSPQKQEKKG